MCAHDDWLTVLKRDCGAEESSSGPPMAGTDGVPATAQVFNIGDAPAMAELNTREAEVDEMVGDAWSTTPLRC